MPGPHKGVFTSTVSPFFAEATDATFGFTLASAPDAALGPYGEFKLSTVQGAATATLFTPSEDLTGAIALKTLQTTSFNWKDINLNNTFTLLGEVVVSGKQSKVTVTFYNPTDNSLVAALVGNVAAGFTGFTRVALFTWVPT